MDNEMFSQEAYKKARQCLLNGDREGFHRVIYEEIKENLDRLARM